MITNISLSNVASYRSVTELNTDKKVNIIYGLNGTGKSTFSNYFYNNEDPIYGECSHFGEYDSILVYNQKFIQDNFYAKDTLKGIFSLSKENKEAKNKVDEIVIDLENISKKILQIQEDIDKENSQIKDAKEKVQIKIWEIKTNYTGGDRVLDFCLKGKIGSKELLFQYLCSIPLIAQKPSKTIADIKMEANAITGDRAIKYSLFSKLSIMDLTAKQSGILNEIIIGSKDSPVSKLIGKLENSDWVSDGLEYLKNIDDDSCPFCQSNTITEQLVEQINAYFDESYKASVAEIELVSNDYIAIIDSMPNFDIYKESTFSYGYLAELSESYSQIASDLSFNLDLINQKVANPSIKITLKDISVKVKEFNLTIDSINDDIVLHNNKIDNSEIELEKIKIEFWSILRYEYDQSISLFMSMKNTADATIFSKKEEKIKEVELRNKKNEEREKYQKSTVNIDDAISNINQGLEEIGITEFYIEKYEEDLYRIVRTSSNSKIFSSLSEGEKMIISFLYFRELFRGRQNSTDGKLKKIAVIDDPVSSLSHIFVYNIGRLLKTDFFSSQHIEQVFVLTHSLYFFYELTDINKERRNLNQNLFRLSKNQNGTSINIMKYEEIQNDYQSYWSIVNDEEQPPVLIANCMRNIIEYFFNFVQKADLSNVSQKSELQGIRFQSFLRYINRESHSLGQNIFDFKEFDYRDFKEGLRLLFEHTGYSAHYIKMSKIKS